MKLIANENFQFRRMHREGTTLTVSETFLKDEIEKGRHPSERYGRFPWLSGLLEHCTPANEATSAFIEKASGKRIDPATDKSDEQDDSEEIREIRAEFNTLGKAYDKRWKLTRLQNELVKAKKEVGEIAAKEERNGKDFRIGDE